MSGEDTGRTGSSRRTVLKRIGAGSAALGILGGTVGSSPVAAADDWDPDNDGEFGHVDMDWEVVDEYRGDDVYEFSLHVAWGTLERDENIHPDHTRGIGKDTLTVYWSDNVWEFYDFTFENCYGDYAYEVVDEYDGSGLVYERDGWYRDSDIHHDDKLLHGESDGWTVDFEIQDEWYEAERSGQHYSQKFAPMYVSYFVKFQLLHQDSSSGRVLYEIAREVEDGAGSVSICGGAGPGSICYDTGWGGGPEETMDSGYGWLVP